MYINGTFLTREEGRKRYKPSRDGKMPITHLTDGQKKLLCLTIPQGAKGLDYLD